MNVDQIENVYLIGAGGIGMSAIARYFKYIGKNVAGYDKTSTALTSMLIEEGIDMHFIDQIDLIPAIYKNELQKEKTLIVYTPAVPSNHAELTYFTQNNFQVIKRAKILGIINQTRKTIAIAGTHGKTTTTTLTAHLLMQSSIGCAAFLGGISKNYKTNFVLPHHANSLYKKDEKLNDLEYVVLEADEFDRSFLQLNPHIAVITSVDADHLDIYGSKSEVINAFNQFIEKISPEGILIIKKGVNLAFEKCNAKTYTYSLKDSKSDFYAMNISHKNGLYNFDIVTPDRVMEDLTLGAPGLINVENAIAAAAVAYFTGVEDDKIKNALESFAGVERRFDFQIKRESLIYIDDYAHHPEELTAFIRSVRDLFPGRKITGIFQPHLYSRTKDFADEFAKSLEFLDELILLEIYPAREEPIEGVTSQMIFEKVNLEEKFLCEKVNLIDFLKNRKVDVLVTLGAGDIDKLVKPIKEHLEEREE